MHLDTNQIKMQLSTLKGWQLLADKPFIFQDFLFEDFQKTMEFVNAVANIAQQENHHPEMEVGYNHCKVTYTTHSLAGLGEKDFTCARRINAFLKIQ